MDFRHRSWLDEDKKEINPEALEVLGGRNVANVVIDGHGSMSIQSRPQIILTSDSTAGTMTSGTGGGEDDHRLDRYDCLYKKEQLERWFPGIREAELKTTKVSMFFNNHARAKAIMNAFQIMDMLPIEHKSKEIQLQDQFTLGEFGK